MQLANNKQLDRDLNLYNELSKQLNPKSRAITMDELEDKAMAWRIILVQAGNQDKVRAATEALENFVFFSNNDISTKQIKKLLVFIRECDNNTYLNDLMKT